MKRLTLTRHWYDDDRTIGLLEIGDEWISYTMEPGKNDVDSPKLPAGFYHLVRHDNPEFRYEDTWALVGIDVSHQPEPGISRFSILFHGGNTDEQTAGCILLGTTIGRVRDEVAMVSSKDALNKLRNILGNAEAYLTIKGE
jgi:hypothetical protein